MKRTILLFISITFVTTVFGQGTVLIQNFYRKYDIDCYSIKKHLEKKSDKYLYYRKSKTKHESFRSVIDAKQKLDSLITKSFWESINEWVYQEKYEYSYDDSGNTNIIIENDWDYYSGIWIPDTKVKYSFNTLNNPTEELRNYWNDNANKWIPYRKYEYLYDNNDNLILKTRTDTNEITNQWVNKWKVDYLYDVNFRLLLEQYSIWDTLTNQFIQSWEHGYTYDSIGNLISEISIEWLPETGQWRNENKFIYTYNINNLDSTIVYFKRDYDGNDSLIYRWKNEIFYDSNNYDKIEKISSWKKDLSQWKAQSLYEHNFTTDGKHELEILNYWRDDPGYWSPSTKDEFTYDNNGNLSLYRYYIPIDSTGTWRISRKREYNYNSTFNISEIFFPTFDWYPIEYYDHITKMPTDYMAYATNFGVLHEDFELIYYYSELNIGVLETQNIGNMFYPNPTTGRIFLLRENKIDVNEVIIYNQLGQKVLYEKVISNEIDLSILKQGVYIVEFVSNNLRIREKLIIEK